MSYSVAQRTREIGIRMAVGAQRGDVLKLIVRQGMVLTGCGVILGLIASFGLTRLMSNLLYGVSATDMITFLGVSALLSRRGAARVLDAGATGEHRRSDSRIARRVASAVA